jgi:hypothetical protein
LDHHADALDHRADTLDHGAEALDDRADALDDRADALDDRADALDHRADTLDHHADALDDRADALDDRADAQFFSCRHWIRLIEEPEDQAEHASISKLHQDITHRYLNLVGDPRFIPSIHIIHFGGSHGARESFSKSCSINRRLLRSRGDCSTYEFSGSRGAPDL